MNANTKTFTLDQIDDLDTFHICLSVVADLMVPSKDLSTVNRDELAQLLRHLTCEQEKVLDTRPFSNDCLDELDRLQSYFSAIADLMVPHSDLSTVNRDDLAGLLMYLTDGLHKSTEGVG